MGEKVNRERREGEKMHSSLVMLPNPKSVAPLSLQQNSKIKNQTDPN